MKNYLIKTLVNAIGLLTAAYFITGIRIENYRSALLAALILALLNAFLKPLLIVITLPINILSLGFFTLLINTFMLYISSKLVAGFVIEGFWSAFFGALCLSAVSFLLNVFVGNSTKFDISYGAGGARKAPVSGTVIEAEVVEDKKEKVSLPR
jgi:putative membrane protein